MKVNEVKRAHRFAMGADRAGCTCGWQSEMRVGRVSVAREKHRSHVEQVLADLAKEA